MPPEHQSLILRFRDEGSREEFLQKARSERGDITALLTISRVMPHVIAESPSVEQRDWIERNVGPWGRVFFDVEFEPFFER